jgi:multisubunit Na+/H+ antiporter MnhG subunit
MVPHVLVYIAVLLTLLATWLMLRMKDEYQMMHFMSVPAAIAPMLITAAIFVQQGMKPESFKAMFTTLVLMAMNSAVTHATARAFRIRRLRESWRPAEGQEVPLLSGDQMLPAGRGAER